MAVMTLTPRTAAASGSGSASGSAWQWHHRRAVPTSLRTSTVLVVREGEPFFCYTPAAAAAMGG